MTLVYIIVVSLVFFSLAMIWEKKTFLNAGLKIMFFALSFFGAYLFWNGRY